MSEDGERIAKLEAIVDSAIPRIDKNTEKIFTLLDGKDGVVAVSTTNNKQIGYLKWIVGVLMASVIGTAGYIIKTNVA